MKKAQLPWKPWHQVVSLRDDLRSGELPLHLFAADLHDVLMQSGKRPVYEQPEQFFALTYPTYNLRQLVRDVVLRVAGRNDKAVRQLELTYGGGKTHTLITLRHLVTEPDGLPDLPAVKEFVAEIGQAPPRARVAGLCFDKLDVEKGMEVRAPDGQVRLLRQPWSVLAYQIAGDRGLELLHAENRSEERDSAPAENLLIELLELPVEQDHGVLILIDEVLMYVREKVALDGQWRGRIVNFFQYLTQAATKVDRCCIVASLLASDPAKSDGFGRQLQGELYDIFQRQREAAVEPVVKEDVAEVLRRRFFTPESLKDREAFRPHVQTALKGIAAIDEQTARQGAGAEERYLRSYPFHPELTEVFYTKWTQLGRFQKTRGVLRTFALALRAAEQWDTAPLVGPNVLLNQPGQDGLSEALRELVTVADTEQHEGKQQAWTGILEGELGRVREIQRESVGLQQRELEQAVIATFLHSQPIGHSARTADLTVLLGAGRPDKIELEKGLLRWTRVSFWLDDRYTALDETRLPDTWRLGDRPNLNQMHAVAASRIDPDLVRARLLDEIGKAKALSAGASAAGVRVHTLPTRPRDVEDDGQFHYAILGPSAASESGKPGPETCRFLDETTGPDKPRVYRNAVLLLVPSRDGLEAAEARVRDYLAWERVQADLKQQEQEGTVDAARLSTLTINLDRSRKRIPDAILQAYSTVVTVSRNNDIQAFKINVADEPHFTTIKNHPGARIQDTAISAEALLPDGPYNLWREGETHRRVKDLAGAFAQLPHLPKMLKARAILDTLMEGCEQGLFVLRLIRPDGSSRTWWRNRPDEVAANDPAMELVLPDASELDELPYRLLLPGGLPELWKGDQITVQAVRDHFSGGTVVQIQREGYQEPMPVPRAGSEVVDAAVRTAVETGSLWLINGPASLLSESIPAGVLTASAALRAPPAALQPAGILPENLPDAWTDGVATGLAIAAALSQKMNQTFPWHTVKEVIDAAIRTRFLELDAASGAWPCDYTGAAAIRLKPVAGSPKPILGTGEETRGRIASAELEPSEIQELGDLIPQLLDVKAKTGVPIRFHVRVELGDGKSTLSDQLIQEIERLLNNVQEGFGFNR